LPSIAIAWLFALKNRRQFTGIVITKRHRRVNRFMERAVLNSLAPVAMQGGGRKAVFFLWFHVEPRKNA
jgi:hypothetical protein